MDSKLFYFALFQLFISLLLGILILYLTYRVVRSRVLQKTDPQHDNLAYAILFSGILFSTGYIISGVSQPIIETVRLLSKSHQNLFVEGSKYVLLFVSLGLIIAYIVNIVALSVFSFLTKEIDEMAEIRKKNVAVALIIATISIVISLMVKDSAMFLLQAFVPYPDVIKVY